MERRNHTAEERAARTPRVVNASPEEVEIAIVELVESERAFQQAYEDVRDARREQRACEWAEWREERRRQRVDEWMEAHPNASCYPYDGVSRH